MIPNELLQLTIDFTFANNNDRWLAPIFVSKAWQAVCLRSEEFKRYRTREVAILILKMLTLCPISREPYKHLGHNGGTMVVYSSEYTDSSAAEFSILHHAPDLSQWLLNANGETMESKWRECRIRLIDHVAKHPKSEFSIIQPTHRRQWTSGISHLLYVWMIKEQCGTYGYSYVHIAWPILCANVEYSCNRLTDIVALYNEQKERVREVRSWMKRKNRCVLV